MNKETSGGNAQDQHQNLTEPCARITELSFRPDTVEPKAYFDATVAVQNCSDRPERLGLRLEYRDASGILHRQDFPAPLNLQAHETKKFTHPYVAPEEPGSYTINATVSEGARDLDTAGDILTVRRK